MKVLHVITSLEIGGAERLMVDLLPRLRGNDNNDIEILLFNGKDTPFKDTLKMRGIKVYELSKSKDYKKIHRYWSAYNPTHILRLKKFLHKYDIIHTHNTACQFYVPTAVTIFKSSVKLITTEHSINNRRRSLVWFKHFDQWMYDKYNKIICISDQAKKSLISYVQRKTINSLITIYNGVDVDRFVRPVADISKKQNYTISMIAAFRKEKDHETLLMAISRLPMNYRLQLAGRDYDGRVAGLKKICREYGIEDRVVFLGSRSDVPELLEKSDVVVLSSHWEAFGLAAVEAMASGRPLVASDVGGLRDVVGGAGVLFPHGDDKALAEKIQYLCEHPDEYREVAESCQEKAKQYDISVMAEKYLELYKKVYEENQKDN